MPWAIYKFASTKFTHINILAMWFNSEIRHSMKCLRTLHHRYKSHPTHHTSGIIDSLEKAFQDKIKAAKLIFESHLINNYVSTDNIWNPSQRLTIFFKLWMPIYWLQQSQLQLIQPVFSFSFSWFILLPKHRWFATWLSKLYYYYYLKMFIYKALVSLYVKKSGMDKISPRVLQCHAEALSEPLHHLFSQSLHYAKYLM